MTAKRGLLTNLKSLYILIQLGSASLFFVIFPSLVLGSRAEPISMQQHLKSPVQSDAGEPYSEIVMSIHQQVNELRRAQGLKPLTLNSIISAQAKEHSIGMARTGSTVSHRGFDERLKDIKEKLPYRAAAENVATNIGYKNPAREAVEGWKNSQGHRKNMLGDYNLTGIGVARNAQGHYFFTQIFLRQ